MKRKTLKHIWLLRTLLIAGLILSIFLLVLFVRFIFLSDNFPRVNKLQVIEGRTNILLLGKSGEGYLAPDLTDTIIFISISHQKPYSISLISIPRDIWIESLRAKINSAYYWGNQKKAGGGMALAKSTVEEIVDQPIPYAVVVDFGVFTRLIDTLGGIEVEVERGFVDNHYPIAGREADLCSGDPELRCRYETIEFKEGTILMNGEMALKFVRSRNAEGDEGTDLARASRQQKVIIGIKNKILSPGTLLSPGKLIGLWKIGKSSVETDVPTTAAIYFLKISFFKPQTNSYTLPEDLLENPPISGLYDNQYVFVPKSGNWREVQQWVKNQLY